MEKTMSENIFTPADILIPGAGPEDDKTAFEKWSVIACDQFSSQPEYWENVKTFTGDAPSALNLIIPEAYLEETDEKAKAAEIGRTMEEYLEKGVLREIKDSFIFVERTQPDGRIRRGLVGTVDLETYDFSKNETPVRASEGTILERLPARVNIRKAAPLELPHIIAFINDKEKTVIEPLIGRKDSFRAVYDFTLMQGGGHIKGYRITGETAEGITAAISKLCDNSDILMIIGDGNHSLAGAKVYWDEIKQNLSESERSVHPARRALIEVSNVYDDAIDFEAIHRVLFNMDTDAYLKAFENTMPAGNDYEVIWTAGERSGVIGIAAACIGDMLVLVQDFTDEYTKANPGTIIDYIHGEQETKDLSRAENTLGLVLPAMDKSELFNTVAIRGVFPRKSFSVGHARDKRYYLECRKIK